MKAAVLLFLFMVIWVGVNAQIAVDAPPDVHVVKHSWAKERIDWAATQIMTDWWKGS